MEISFLYSFFMMKRYLWVIVVSFFVLGLSAKNEYKPIRLKVMTYNLRFGELSSLKDLASHIKSFNPDIVALQEVDVKTFRERAPKQNGRSFINELAYRTGLFGVYGKTIEYKKGFYGIGILSKFPYVETKKMMLPRPNGKEQRTVLMCTLELNAKDTIVFASTHLDYFSSETRQLQVKILNSVLLKQDFPVLLGGDFNAKPDSPEIETMFLNWVLLTDLDFSIPSWAPRMKIDYIWGYPKSKWKLKRTQTVQSVLSDHLPIVSEVELISNTKNDKNEK